MSKLFFAIAFALGAGAIVWVGAGFMASHGLALAVTALIGVVYGIGCIEMLLFRQATTSLAKALKTALDSSVNLDAWLEKIHPSLQSAVRLRVEGERIPLPGPALTPYLVGLLVMLGMLGTFVGMVATLNGAVFALEGTPDLEAIRAGLAAPIKGLGLAFGTSVAGVAASAMLGLISTLSRRERALTAQLLDKKITTDLRGFSLAHHRQETFTALQRQAQALPDVVDKLHAMAQQMERLGQQLNERLVTNQENFHGTVKVLYTELAQSVEKSLKESLADSGRLAGETIKPIVTEAMAAIGREAKTTQDTLLQAAHTHMDGVTERFSQAATSVANTWQDALAHHDRTSASLMSDLHNALGAFNTKFDQTTGALLTAYHDAAKASQQDQSTADQTRLALWSASLETITAKLSREWQHTTEQTLAQQRQICTALETTARDITSHSQTSASHLLSEMTQLLSQSETLLRQRMATEDTWVKEAHNTHEKLIATTQQQLDGFAARFNQSATDLSGSWLNTLNQQAQTHDTLIAGLNQSLAAFNQQFVQTATSLLASFNDAATTAHTDHAASDQKRIDLWQSALQALATTLKQEWQQAGDHALAQQQKICATLETTARDITEHTQGNAAKTFAEISQLLRATETLIQTRMASEETWLIQQQERTEHLASLLRSELSQLRDAEAARGNAAVEQLSGLQSAVATHLATLGTALEAPMTQLINTASEAPRAAAEVITQLRQEMSNNMARDNQLLAERNRIMEGLDSLLTSLNRSSTEQRAAIETLVNGSADRLHQVGEHFTAKVEAQADKLSDIAAQVTGSAVEVSSLSEAFGFAVQRFGESNEKLIENLQRIEATLDKSSTRSDEQLAYYVAQAREIIDLSMLSQKEIFEELRQLQANKDVAVAEVS